MRSSGEDNKTWLGPATPEISNGNGNITFEFQKGTTNRTPNHHRTSTTIGKPTPSKWDDAQKWLSGVGFARGGEKGHHSRSGKPRNSNADDLRLIASASQREREGKNQYVEYDEGEMAAGRVEVETKNVDFGGESVWRKESINPTAVIRSVCVRDMGTEMTPIGSQEPSRTATPVRATTPVGMSPVMSPVRPLQSGEVVGMSKEARSVASNSHEKGGFGNEGNKKGMSALEARAMAWDEAERAKFMARYKREEGKIHAWENHEKRKAEMEMKKMEAKAERMKARAEEKLANKLTATKRIAEERRSNAEAKLNEKVVRTSEKADYIRRSGHLPCAFSFKLPSLCW